MTSEIAPFRLKHLFDASTTLADIDIIQAHDLVLFEHPRSCALETQIDQHFRRSVEQLTPHLNTFATASLISLCIRWRSECV